MAMGCRNGEMKTGREGWGNGKEVGMGRQEGASGPVMARHSRKSVLLTKKTICIRNVIFGGDLSMTLTQRSR